MEKVMIVTDSTCDLTNEILDQFNIKVIPLYVSFNETTYKDRVDITTEQLYNTVDELAVLPKTSCPSVGDFYEFFKPIIDDGFDIVYVGISSKLSGTQSAAQIASSEFGEDRIYIVDSKNLSSGVGLIALKAAMYAKEGFSASEVAKKANEIVPKIETAFVIDTMEYLHKGGRCSGIARFFGTVLKIKPIIHVVDGEMMVGQKPRGRKKAYDILLNKIYGDKLQLDPNFVMVTHSLNFEAARYLKSNLQKKLTIDNLYETTAGCVISSHCGKGTIGILYITK